MSPFVALVNLEGLEQSEIASRQILLETPEDLDARIHVAWCLFVRALHQAGRESALASLISAEREGEPADCRVVSKSDAQSLLNECLRQTYIVIQLSARTAPRADVVTLHNLVHLWGGKEELQAAEAQAAQILDNIAQDLMRDD